MESCKTLDLKQVSIKINVISHEMLDKLFSVAIRTQRRQYPGALACIQAGHDLDCDFLHSPRSRVPVVPSELRQQPVFRQSIVLRQDLTEPVLLMLREPCLFCGRAENRLSPSVGEWTIILRRESMATPAAEGCGDGDTSVNRTEHLVESRRGHFSSKAPRVDLPRKTPRRREGSRQEFRGRVVVRNDNMYSK